MKYKAKECFQMKDIAGDKVVIPRGEIAVGFNGILVLNDACVVLWENLKDFSDIDTLADIFVEKFKIDFDLAKSDIQNCIDKMMEHNLLDVGE